MAENEKGKTFYAAKGGFRLFGRTWAQGEEFDPFTVPINHRKLKAMQDEGYLVTEKPAKADAPAPIVVDGEVQAPLEPANLTTPPADIPGTAGTPPTATLKNTGGGWYEVSIDGREPERIKGRQKAEAWVAEQGATVAPQE